MNKPSTPRDGRDGVAGKSQLSKNSKVTDFFSVSPKDVTNISQQKLSSPQCKTPSPKEMTDSKPKQKSKTAPSANSSQKKPKSKQGNNIEKPSSSQKSEASKDDNKDKNIPGSTGIDVTITTPEKSTPVDMTPSDSLAKAFGQESEIKSTGEIKATPTSKASPQKETPKPKVSQKLPTYKFKIHYKKGKPTYIEMIHEAILKIGDRTGSSIPALTKQMMENHEYLKEVSPKQFKANFNLALKAALKEKRFTKIKASYKINSEWVKGQTQALRTKELARRAREAKRKKEVEQARAERKKKEEEKKKLELQEKKRIEEEKLAKKIEEAKAKNNDSEKLKALKEAQEKKIAKEEEKRKAAIKAKELAEKIRKRKFPMDDTLLRAEDKLLGVKPPEGTAKLATLPYALECCLPFEHQHNNKSFSLASNSSTSSTNGSRGLISDTLQVFNFFQGDVGFCRLYPGLVPDFSFSHLMYSINEILLGNAKSARTLPPLISHLFFTSLKILLRNEDLSDILELGENQSSEGGLFRIKKDLEKLGKALNSLSWSDILFYYMDLMHRFYTTDASLEPNIVPGLPIPDNFFQIDDLDPNETDNVVENPAETHSSDLDSTMPKNYLGYLGDSQGSLACAYDKLPKTDPWNLSAEELMALLRALTDDIIGLCPKLGQNIAEREVELYELLKLKKAAESTFRKVRLAYEGPRWKGGKRVKKEEKKDERKDEKREDKEKKEDENEKNALDIDVDESRSKEDIENKSEDGKTALEPSKEVPKFKPTATKKEFELAEKARQKAVEAYEKGLKKLISRSEPIGVDRNSDSVYYFRHNPDIIFIEKTKTSSKEPLHVFDFSLLNVTKSWHVIRDKTTFDDFVASLDIRGTREDELYDALMGSSGASSLKRFMYDDCRKKNAILARKREEEEFERRLQNAMIACAADDESGGRRSRRLASTAHDELAKIKAEMKLAAKMYESSCKTEPIEYSALTGLDLMTEFDEENEAKLPELSFCSKLWHDENDESTGSVGLLIEKFLHVEDLCENLIPSKSSKKSRSNLLLNLGSLRKSWNNSNLCRLGPPDDMTSDTDSDFYSSTVVDRESGGKKRKRSLKSEVLKNENETLSVSQLLKGMKGPLVELESRVFSVTGLEMATNEADEANENSSVISTKGNQLSKKEHSATAWKKKINMLKKIQGRNVNAVRDCIIAAITLARKSKQKEALLCLRESLHLCSPNSAVEARESALNVLSKHGGYEPPSGEDSYDSDANDSSPETPDQEDLDESVESLLCADAMMITGCLDGDETADRVDWKDAVMGCKTLSRFSAVALTFLTKAEKMLTKLQEARIRLDEAIQDWESSGPKKRKRSKYDSSTEIWTDVVLTDQFILGKVKGYPWWPARICQPKDKKLTISLKSVGRTIISFIGETHLFAVKDVEIREFVDNFDDKDLNSFTSEIKDSYQKSLSMAKRIRRSRENSSAQMIEEKKSTS